MHASVGGVVFRGVPGINTVIIGAVPALCENAPMKCNCTRLPSIDGGRWLATD